MASSPDHGEFEQAARARTEQLEACRSLMIVKSIFPSFHAMEEPTIHPAMANGSVRNRNAFIQDIMLITFVQELRFPTTPCSRESDALSP